MLYILLLFLQHFIQFGSVSYDNRINDSPDYDIADNKNCWEYYDRYYAEVKPIVNQISCKISDIQNTAMNENRRHERQTLNLIDCIHAARKESQYSQWKYANARFIDS